MPVRPSLLLLEDDESVAKGLRRELEQAGFGVSHEVRGDASLGRIASMFDVAVLDVHVPALGGLDVLRCIKESSPQTECIILTGAPDLETALAAFRAGAFEYLAKPVDLEKLVDTVKSAIEHGRRRTAAALHQVARIVLTSDDPSALPGRIARFVKRQLRADDVSLMVPDAEGMLRILHADGLPDEVASAVRVPLGDRVVGRVALSREPAILRGASADDPRFSDVPGDPTIAASIVYPVVAGSRLLAVLNVNRRGDAAQPFHLEDLEQVGVIAAQIRMWLENAELGARQRATEQLVAMGELVASVAHELSSPLAYLSSNLTFVRDHFSRLDAVGRSLILESGLVERWTSAGGFDAQEDLKEAIGDSQEAVSRIRQLVQDLKQMSRPREELAQKFDLSAAVEAAHRLAGAQLKRCVVSKDFSAGVEVASDRGRLTQVFVNLLVNAAHAVEAAPAERRRVHVRVARMDDWAIAEVSDTGSGIPEAVLPRIFDPFFTTKPAGQGTGLGLSISQGIVARYGGQLEVLRTGPDGTTFRLKLPIAPTD